MKYAIAAAFALTAPSSLIAQVAAPAATSQAPSTPDLSTATAVAGNWVYAPISGGSEISFIGASERPQLTIRCMRTTRRVTISKPASAASPTLWVWTSSQQRSLPATFNAATGLVSADLANFDPLLDAIAFSRGRIGVSVSGTTPLVLPAWADLARVVEDCRV